MGIRDKSRRRLKRERPLPQPCEMCGKTLLKTGNSSDDAVCHHRDGQPSNSDLENLQWLCHFCHNSHHHAGKIISDTHRAALSRAHRGRSLSREHAAKIGAAVRAARARMKEGSSHRD